MMSVQGEADYLRRSMLAGAREFLVKPFSSDELTASIRQVYTREQEKQSRLRRRAGHGRRATAPGRAAPTAAAAIATARSSRSSARRAASAGRRSRSTWRSPPRPSSASRSSSMDGSFQFGDVGVLLNLNPKNKSIADLVPELEAGEPESLDTFVINHSAGVRVLLAPPSPEMAELITPTAVKRVLEALRRQPRPRHRRLHVAGSTRRRWRSSTRPTPILTMLSLEITSIKNMRLFLEVADQLGYEHGQGQARPQSGGLQPRHPGHRCRELDRPEGRPHDRQRRSERGVRAQSGRTLLPVEPGGRRSPRTSCGSPRRSRANASRRGRMMPARTRRKSRCSHSDDHVGRW